MSRDFIAWMDEQPWIMLDGAMGTMLMAAGIPQGAASEAWNADQPQQVAAIHRAYIEAGAQIVLTNSFGGGRFRLEQHGMSDRVEELNAAAARLARDEADASERRIWVAGSMGPAGLLMEPMGALTPDLAREGFAEQARALASGGVDMLWVETMSDLSEAVAAVEGIRATTELPFAVTMTFESHGHTMMGVSPSAAFEALLPYKPVAIGANCGNGPAEIEDVIATMAGLEAPVPLIAKSNAGMPRLAGDQIVYDASPRTMGEHAGRVFTQGARLIGGCCGNTPEHISAMYSALRER